MNWKGRHEIFVSSWSCRMHVSMIEAKVLEQAILFRHTFGVATSMDETLHWKKYPSTAFS